MDKAIVITTINKPSEAIKKFSQIKGWETIVVADTKTPKEWWDSGMVVHYLSMAFQKDYTTFSHLPYDTYARKMVGYAYAIEKGATIIVDSDDDNIPKDNWSTPEFEGYFNIIPENGFVNIYKYYSDDFIWARGLPLNHIHKDFPSTLAEKEYRKVGVWQGLADESPDIDAIARLVIDGEPYYFNDNPPIVLDKKTISPFNSQNTAFRKELFPLLYLPSTVTFRFTDILRSLIAQPIMWNAGYVLGFTNATVTQKRNPHNLMVDFESEVPCYLHTEKIIDIVNDAIKTNRTIRENLVFAYERLLNFGIVKKEEIKILNEWLRIIK